MKTRLNTPLVMQLKNIFSQKMCYLLLLSSGMAFAQLAINSPTPYKLCDNLNNNEEIFNLSTKNLEILGSLDPQLYNVNYFTTLSGANNNTDNIINTSNYVSGNNTIYVKVTDNLDQNNFNITSLNLELISTPVYGNPSDLFVEDIPFDGSSIFDLTINSTVLINGQTDISVTYYSSQSDAQLAIAPIPDPTSYVGNNGQQIWVRLQSSITGCYSTITSFRLYTTNPNIVLIQDTNFKAKLLSANTTNNIAFDVTMNSCKVDINGDGEIQDSEALIIHKLDLNNSYISSLNGISSFTNLETLFCKKNSLVSLDVNSLSNLYYLDCSKNINLVSLALNNLTAIRTLDCSNNHLTSITINPVAQIQELNVSLNPLTSLDVNSLTSLKKLNCTSSHLLSLEVNNLINLEVLNCSENLLTSIIINPVAQIQELNVSSNPLNSLNVNNFTSLKKLNCNSNNLSSLEVNNLVNLEDLECHDNQITTLNVNSLTNLHLLRCWNNLLTTLDVSGIPSLLELACYNNLLTTFDLSTIQQVIALTIGNQGFQQLDYNLLPNLHFFHFYGGLQTDINVSNLAGLLEVGFSNTNLTSIDISANHNLALVVCKNNINLLNFNMKCGSSPQYYFQDCQNIQFICADDSNLLGIQNGLNNINIYPNVINNINPNVVVNSYCSFSPGGNYNTITGTMTFDANNNGCDDTDLPQPNIRLNINDTTSQGATFTNNTGNYNFYTPAGIFNLTPDVENPTWFTISPTTATIPFVDVNNNTATQNFCLSANGNHNDVEVVIEPTPARPGFDAVYKIVYNNKGNQSLSGDVSFSYDDSVLDFVSSTLAPNSQSTGVLNWSYTNLMPFENRSFYITLNVNSPMDIPAVTIGDSLTFNATITPIISDENSLDNVFTINQIVVGSFDPNNIICLEGDSVPTSQIGNFLHYGVNFENTGTYPAENIVVKTIIDATKYDINSLQLLNTSNPAYTRITGNVVEFIFNQINLDSGGHGDVLFKIRTLTSLVNGDMVSKEADIFFDYNAPIATGMANTTFQNLNNPQFVIDNSILVSPNPTSSNVNINSNFNIKSIQIYDVQGRLLETKLLQDVKTSINLLDKTNGIYFLKITTDKGGKVEKIVKE